MSENVTSSNWRGRIWVGLVGFATIVGALVAVYALIINRENREFETLLLSDTRLSSLQNAPSTLQISYEDEEVTDVRTVTIQIKNTGNRDILKSEFEGPIELETSQDWKIVAASTVEKRPSSLSDDLDWNDHLITMQPLLMNEDDRIKIEIVMVAEAENPDPKAIERLDARIAGVQEVELTGVSEAEQNFDITQLWNWILSMAGVIFISGKIGEFVGYLLLRTRHNSRI